MAGAGDDTQADFHPMARHVHDEHGGKGTGNVPGSLGKLAVLSSLDLRYNAIVGAEPGLCNATILVHKGSGGDCELRYNLLEHTRCADLPWCVREPYSNCYAECNLTAVRDPAHIAQ